LSDHWVVILTPSARCGSRAAGSSGRASTRPPARSIDQATIETQPDLTATASCA